MDLNRYLIAEENLLFNNKDIYYNYNAFENGDINIAIVVGFSGSGKSSLSRAIVNKSSSIEHYELDDLMTNWNFSDENLREYGDLIYSFFKTVGKDFRISYQKLCDEHIDEDHYEKPLLKSFIDYAYDYSKNHKDKKYILEGVWPLLYDYKPEYFNNWCVIIKGTALLPSNIRAVKRDVYNDNKNPTIIDFGKRFLKAFDSKVIKIEINKMNKNIEIWRKYFNKK